MATEAELKKLCWDLIAARITLDEYGERVNELNPDELLILNRLLVEDLGLSRGN